MPINYQSILSLLNAEQEHKIILSNNRMDYKIIRLNSNDADITTTDKKHFLFFLKKPIILNDEYVLQVKEFLVDSTYTTSARVVSAPLIQDMYIRFNNSDWGNTSYGIYTFYSQDATNTLVFEVYDNAGTKQARLLSVTTNFNMNYFDGSFTIYFQPSPPFWAVVGNGTLTHQTLGLNFIWGKATDFVTGATQIRVLVEPSMGRKYKVKIDNMISSKSIPNIIITGEPGTGKTVLAYEIAKALGTPLIEWNIKSTTAQNFLGFTEVAFSLITQKECEYG